MVRAVWLRRQWDGDTEDEGGREGGRVDVARVSVVRCVRVRVSVLAAAVCVMAAREVRGGVSLPWLHPAPYVRGSVLVRACVG